MRKTRKEKAAEVLRLLTDGPSFGIGFPSQTINAPVNWVNGEASASFKRWSASWVLPLVCDLVPELKGVDGIAGRLAAISRVATKES